MNRQVKERMASLGLTTKRYYVEGCDNGTEWRPPVWGLAVIKDGVDVYVIEQSPRDHGGDNKFHIRNERTQAESMGYPRTVAAEKLQRLALAKVIRMMYQVDGSLN